MKAIVAAVFLFGAVTCASFQMLFEELTEVAVKLLSLNTNLNVTM